ncbi:hypothetical protein TSUD_384670 [Trifolium subterraneum]|uniref:Uncharacterized protein n=1 Tax=Trifolium subterraneum TaxID=3900 RepID=A0A2Z6N3W1_TRISU|nr:hypothetical protein TSUD_384670 [Trifolium subterraneum]
MDKFKNKKIAAIFAESPYVKLFLNKHCKDYTATTAAYKFGGMGFVFQEGSPIAKDFSVAILTLGENGKLKDLEDKWLTPSNECSNNSASPQTESLTLDKFWGLYVICAATSTICLLLALLKKYFHKHNNYEEETQPPQKNCCMCLKILPSNCLKVRNWVWLLQRGGQQWPRGGLGTEISRHCSLPCPRGGCQSVNLGPKASSGSAGQMHPVP